MAWYGEAYALLREAAGLGRVAQEGVERAVHEGDLDLAWEVLEFTGRLREVVEGFPLGAQVPEDRLERAEERIVASRGGLEGLREAAKEVVRGLEASSGVPPRLPRLGRPGPGREPGGGSGAPGAVGAGLRPLPGGGGGGREHVERTSAKGARSWPWSAWPGAPEPGA